MQDITKGEAAQTSSHKIILKRRHHFTAKVIDDYLNGSFQVSRSLRRLIKNRLTRLINEAGIAAERDQFTYEEVYLKAVRTLIEKHGNDSSKNGVELQRQASMINGWRKSRKKKAATRANLRQRIRMVRKLPRVTADNCYLEVISIEGGGLSRVGITRDHKMIALMGGTKPPQGSLAVVQRVGLGDLIGFAYEVEGGVRVDWPDCEGHIWRNAKIVGEIIGVVVDEVAEGAIPEADSQDDSDEWPEIIGLEGGAK